MNENNIVIGSAKFLSQLIDGTLSSNRGVVTVQGDVVIDGNKLTTEDRSLSFDCINFTNLVVIRNCGSVGIRVTDFLGGLVVQSCRGCSFKLSSCKARMVTFEDSDFYVVHLYDLDIEKYLNVSGLRLSQGLTMNKVGFANLKLVNDNGPSRIDTPFVRTDDLVIAYQCRMACIPVIIPTASVKLALERDLHPLR